MHCKASPALSDRTELNWTELNCQFNSVQFGRLVQAQLELTGVYLEWQTTRDFSSRYSDSRAAKYTRIHYETFNVRSKIPTDSGAVG